MLLLKSDPFLIFELHGLLQEQCVELLVSRGRVDLRACGLGGELLGCEHVPGDKIRILGRISLLAKTVE